MADQILFKFPEYVQLWQTDRNVPNINGPMIQYNTKIYKGATNTIDFVTRNNDRKPVNLVGYQMSALIQRVEYPEILLEKSVYATDELAGKARLTLLPEDINQWTEGYYRYSIRITDVTGKQEFLYTDVNRSTTGNFELIEGMSVSLAPALTVVSNQFTPYPFGYYDTTFSTGAIAGDAQAGRSNGMHTVVAYTTDFVGDFWIQGSLTLRTPNETDWFDIPLSSTAAQFTYGIGNTTNIKVFNFTGNYYWIRMFYRADQLNTGTFDKILYKN